MRAETPSRTAAWVALARGMAARLPPEARLADDPFGAAFEDPGPRVWLHAMLERAGIPLARLPAIMPWVLYMQVRTRVIDDAVREFVADGGRQIVLLGAGYDCRALRMPELATARVFEVDHPATQTRKREVLARLGAESRAHYLAWDFEARALADLPDALAGCGLDRGSSVMTIWEGVTMYLTPPAIDASLRAIRAWSASGSLLSMTYFTTERFHNPSWRVRVVRAVVARIGEPFRFTWDPAELPEYLAHRGFSMVRDVTTSDAAHQLLAPPFAERLRSRDQRIALARVA
jgi:methyltransferase (TIGR00027 family)